MRLYKEMAKGSELERGVMFGREQNGVPGEAHIWEKALAARSMQQVRGDYRPGYTPGQVEGMGGLAGPLSDHYKSAVEILGGLGHARLRDHGAICPEGESILIDKQGNEVCGRGAAPARGVGGLGDLAAYALGVDGNAIQKTFMSHRDFEPDTQTTLPNVMQHFEQGLVRPERADRGMRAVSEHGQAQRSRDVAGGRLRPEPKKGHGIRGEVNELGELEPRMGVWGHEQKDRQGNWFSPPGPRRLAKRDQVVATQSLRGLGDISGPGLGDIAASYQVAPDQKTALSKGYGQLFYQGGSIGITTPHGPIVIVDASTVYPTMQEALKRGFGVMYQQGSQVVVSGPAGPTPINSPKTSTPPPTPTPVSQLAPPPAKPGGVFVPPPPPAGSPPLPSGGSLTNPNAPQVAPPGTTLQTVAGPQVTTTGGGLAPIAPGPATRSPTPYQPGTIVNGPNGQSVVAADGVTLIPLSGPATGGAPASAGGTYSGGGGGGGGGGGADMTAPDPSAAPPAPTGPLSFLTKPINIPIVGDVPTWVPIGIAAFLLWKRRKKGRAA